MGTVTSGLLTRLLSPGTRETWHAVTSEAIGKDPNIDVPPTALGWNQVHALTVRGFNCSCRGAEFRYSSASELRQKAHQGVGLVAQFETKGRFYPRLFKPNDGYVVPYTTNRMIQQCIGKPSLGGHFGKSKKEHLMIRSTRSVSIVSDTGCKPCLLLFCFGGRV